VIPGKKTERPPHRLGGPIVSVPFQKTADASGIHISKDDDGTGETQSVVQHGCHLLFPLGGPYFERGPKMEAVGSQLLSSHRQGARHRDPGDLPGPARVRQEDLLIFHNPPGRQQGVAKVLSVGFVDDGRIIDIVQAQMTSDLFDALFIHLL